MDPHLPNASANFNAILIIRTAVRIRLGGDDSPRLKPRVPALVARVLRRFRAPTSLRTPQYLAHLQRASSASGRINRPARPSEPIMPNILILPLNAPKSRRPRYG